MAKARGGFELCFLKARFSLKKTVEILQIWAWPTPVGYWRGRISDSRSTSKRRVCFPPGLKQTEVQESPVITVR